MGISKYSPIKELHIKNFRNIGDVSIDFSETPIVSLIGENESGKTSVVKAFSVCAMHTDPRYQKEYIRDGTNGFGVVIQLEDGTQIQRIKKRDGGNRYAVVNADGTEWSADKLENEVPKAVQDVMGLIEEPETKELLHIRTYEDLLLFVNTSASTNYKVMYDALKISQITKAIKAGSTEANQLKAKISNCEGSVMTLNQSLAKIKTFDIEPLLNIRNRIQSDFNVIEKMTNIVSLLDDIENKKRQLGSIRILEEYGIEEIDTAEAMTLSSIDRVIQNLDYNNSIINRYTELNNLGEIDTRQLGLMDSILSRLIDINEKTEISKYFIELSEASTISEMEVYAISKVDDLMDGIDHYNSLARIYNLDGANDISQSDVAIINKLNVIESIINKNNEYTNSIGEIDNYIKGVTDWMKAVGVSTTSCPKCGEGIVIDLDLVKN